MFIMVYVIFNVCADEDKFKMMTNSDQTVYLFRRYTFCSNDKYIMMST